MRLAVFMDGTWNDPDDDTNVAQLARRVPEPPRGPGGAGQKRCYLDGVGNDLGGRLTGGALGYGVDDKIREGYEFLVENHQPGDEIFLFGFSRGAFTARSLGGMLTKCGIVPADILDSKQVFDRYRDGDRPGLREMQDDEDDPSERTDEDRTVLGNARLERIRFIGVFDTVGALGVPGNIGKAFAWKYQFHNTNLSGFVDIARHAVAIDENRPEFEPTLWTGVPIPIPGHETSIEQRWFVGAHSDVGGGGDRGPVPLCAIPREWIAQEARLAGLDVDAAPALTDTEWKSPYGDSFATWLGAISWLTPWRRPLHRPVNTSVDETLAPSVLRRWTEASPAYRPRNPNLAPWIRRLLG